MSHPEKPVLYYDDLSSSARSVLLLISILNADVQMQYIDLSKGEHLSGTYAEKNPSRSVPTLLHNDVVLTDGHAILMYLCEISEERGARQLLPNSCRERFAVMNTLFFEANVLCRRHSAFMTEILRKTFAKTNMPYHQNKIYNAYDLLEAMLVKSRFLAGPKFTIADISCVTTVSCLNLVFPIQACVERWPKLYHWFHCMISMSHYKTTQSGLNKHWNMLNKVGFKRCTEKEVPRKKKGCKSLCPCVRADSSVTEPYTKVSAPTQINRVSSGSGKITTSEVFPGFNPYCMPKRICTPSITAPNRGSRSSVVKAERGSKRDSIVQCRKQSLNRESVNWNNCSNSRAKSPCLPDCDCNASNKNKLLNVQWSSSLDDCGLDEKWSAARKSSTTYTDCSGLGRMPAAIIGQEKRIALFVYERPQLVDEPVDCRSCYDGADSDDSMHSAEVCERAASMISVECHCTPECNCAGDEDVALEPDSNGSSPAESVQSEFSTTSTRSTCTECGSECECEVEVERNGQLQRVEPVTKPLEGADCCCKLPEKSSAAEVQNYELPVEEYVCGTETVQSEADTENAAVPEPELDPCGAEDECPSETPAEDAESANVCDKETQCETDNKKTDKKKCRRCTCTRRSVAKDKDSLLPARHQPDPDRDAKLLKFDRCAPEPCNTLQSARENYSLQCGCEPRSGEVCPPIYFVSPQGCASQPVIIMHHYSQCSDNCCYSHNVPQ